jgi:hypothetical protein
MREHFSRTEHARKREGQRGVTPEMEKVAMKFGEVYSAGCGAVVYWLNKRALRRISRQLGRPTWLRRARESENLALVMSADNRLLTVMRCNHRQKHWKYLCD